MVAIRFLRRLLVSKRVRWIKDRYFDSWKTSQLLKEVIKEEEGICMTIGVVRHFTALLIKDGLLSDDEELSVEEDIQLIRVLNPGLIGPGDYGLFEFTDCEYVLREIGTVRDRDNPLRYNFEDPKLFDPSYRPERFKIKRMRTIYLKKFEDKLDFENLMIRQLKLSPIACVVKVTDDYYTCGKSVFDPPSSADFEEHVMLLVAYGRYRGKRFFEFQDCNGTDVGRNGFVRVAAGKSLITEYLIIDLPDK